MRSLIVRFEDCEGPGILEPILREEGYAITYHDAYKENLDILPGTHQMFDFFLFMGGSASVYDPQKQSFFQPYIHLIENILQMNDKKILGICLGSQILAKALGAEVKQGASGGEIGIGSVEVLDTTNFLFEGLEKKLEVVHFHGDVFSIPSGTQNLLSSSKYENQMFSNGRNTFGILPHFEITESMFYTWMSRFPEFRKAVQEIGDIPERIQQINTIGHSIFRNIIRKS